MTKKEWSNMFAARVQSRLDYMKMTHCEFYKKAKINRKTMDNYFSGRSVPNAINLLNIAKTLNCSVSYLCDFGERVEKQEVIYEQFNLSGCDWSFSFNNDIKFQRIGDFMKIDITKCETYKTTPEKNGHGTFYFTDCGNRMY